MARPRQPVDLLLIKGKKHLTKKEIEERKSKEIKAASDKVKAPSYLPDYLKEEFDYIAKELKEIGIITNLDIDSLARFIISKKMYLDVTQKILENPDIIINDRDVISAQDKLFKQCRASASDLGLTISSRCKLVMPKKEENKKLSEEEQLFGGKI